MQSTTPLSVRCTAGLHKLDDFTISIVRHKLYCKRCAEEFGDRYDGEWTNQDIKALLGDFQEALQCQCGGPICGPNARTVYAKAYPTLGQLFA